MDSLLGRLQTKNDIWPYSQQVINATPIAKVNRTCNTKMTIGVHAIADHRVVREQLFIV